MIQHYLFPSSNLQTVQEQLHPKLKPNHASLWNVSLIKILKLIETFEDFNAVKFMYTILGHGSLEIQKLFASF